MQQIKAIIGDQVNGISILMNNRIVESKNNIKGNQKFCNILANMRHNSIIQDAFAEAVKVVNPIGL